MQNFRGIWPLKHFTKEWGPSKIKIHNQIGFEDRVFNFSIFTREKIGRRQFHDYSEYVRFLFPRKA